MSLSPGTPRSHMDIRGLSPHSSSVMECSLLDRLTVKMRSLHTLPYLLLLPLSTCFPLLDRRGPTDIDDIRAKMSWANPVEERRPHSVQDPFLWLRVPQPQALLVVAKELQSSHREHTGFPPGRRDRSSQAAGFLPTDAEKASRPLGTLAEELSSYSRRKGGFSFRFGR
ncbi:orexigenic neuropeptide QRFP isoform X2 [Cricetulus griseus]|uniref:orexigenic neuropeptide QRFP isoform X2 n=1 Tax=Cricetulus griseus TaxID=10029 RepID=UPI0004542102|nr:orexigenic neuropeptide QRFP isoform X2 [Cricetulus griseus]